MYHLYLQLNRSEPSPRRDSTSSASSSSKTTLKDDEVFDSPPPLPYEANGFGGAKHESVNSSSTNSSEDSNLNQNSQRPSQMR